MAIFIDISNNEQITEWTEFLSREIWYIHGTIAKPTRWEGFPDTVKACNTIAMDPQSKWEMDQISQKNWINKNCNFTFDWYGKTRTKDGMFNGIDNNVLDRKKASDKLVKELEKRAGKVDEIVLVGHSHGGNVALQAADRLSALFKHIYILTIATPAQNKPFVDSYTPLEGLTEMKEQRTKIPSKGNLYFYINPESPDNLKNWHKLTHLALWNKTDWVDEMALGLDLVKNIIWGGTGGGGGMTFKKNKFTSPHTTNCEFRIKYDYINVDKQYTIMTLWKCKLKQLYHTLYGYTIDGYDLHGIAFPELKEYNLFESTIDQQYTDQEKKYLEVRMYSFVKEGSAPQWLGDKLRKYSLESLFVSIESYGNFLNSVDTLKKNRFQYMKLNRHVDIWGGYTEINPIITNRYSFFKEIEDLDKSIDQQYKINTNILNAGKGGGIDHLLNLHGFDLAHSDKILDAIEKGLIRPFARVKAESEVEVYRETGRNA